MYRYRITNIKLDIVDLPKGKTAGGQKFGINDNNGRSCAEIIAEKIAVSVCKNRLVALKGKAVGLTAKDIQDIEIVRRSIDARKTRGKHECDVQYVLTVDFSCDQKLNLPEPPDTSYVIPKTAVVDFSRPVVVGFGPCGMFCALVLARAGLRPIVLERGKDVDSRQRDVDEFWRTGKLNPESNVQFGEGGAGTFSDGKLNTGIKDSRIRFVLQTFVEAGADSDILIDARPHIGTDALRTVVKNIREEIISLGGEVRFGTRVTGIESSAGKVTGVFIDCGGDHGNEETAKKEDFIQCSELVLALGHSARDTVRILYDQGIAMESKPFSMGVRVQHPQELIDRGMYGDYAELLPPAYYKLSTKASDGRGVYSFCMCPGGEIVNAASQYEGVVTNGMSNHDRDSGFANSGILVDVRPEDYLGADESLTDKRTNEGPHPLDGIAFQEYYEHLAFVNGGSNYSLPTTTWGEYARLFDEREKDGCVSEDVSPDESGAASVMNSLPDFVAQDIYEAIPVFGHKIKGFDNPETIIKAIESRSSSPLRILRDRETLEAKGISGLYPGGEGAGYAGGITSAACDGIKIAERIIAERISVNTII